MSNPVHFLLTYKNTALEPIRTEGHRVTHILIRYLVKFSVVSFHRDFGTQGTKGCLCYVVVVGTVPRKKSLRVMERASTNSHLAAFPTVIKDAYSLDTLAKLRYASISFLMSVYLYDGPSVRMKGFDFHLTDF
jgi:hypothetical protein